MIARAAVPVIERNGGAALVRASVSSLLYENGRVCGVRMTRNDMEVRSPNACQCNCAHQRRTKRVLRRWSQIRAPHVIAACGVINTFTKLLPEEARHRVKPALDAIVSKQVRSAPFPRTAAGQA